MNAKRRRALYGFAASRTPRWYALHPRGDLAVERILDALECVPLISEPWVDRLFPEPCPLTVRELQTVAGFSCGLHAGAIADRLGIGVETVKSYAATAYRKLGATNQTHAVALAIRSGWI